jgi:hypothetical protein
MSVQRVLVAGRVGEWVGEASVSGEQGVTGGAAGGSLSMICPTELSNRARAKQRTKPNQVKTSPPPPPPSRAQKVWQSTLTRRPTAPLPYRRFHIDPPNRGHPHTAWTFRSRSSPPPL